MGVGFAFFFFFFLNSVFASFTMKFDSSFHFPCINFGIIFFFFISLL